MFRLLLQVYSLLPLPSVHELTILYLLVQIYSSLPLPSQMISRSGLKASVHLIPPLVNMIVPPGITRSVFSHGIQVWNYIGEPNVFFSDSCSFSIFILLNCLMNLVIKVLLEVSVISLLFSFVHISKFVCTFLFHLHMVPHPLES